jgi:hypothetical protein
MPGEFCALFMGAMKNEWRQIADGGWLMADSDRAAFRGGMGWGWDLILRDKRGNKSGRGVTSGGSGHEDKLSTYVLVRQGWIRPTVNHRAQEQRALKRPSVSPVGAWRLRPDIRVVPYFPPEGLHRRQFCPAHSVAVKTAPQYMEVLRTGCSLNPAGGFMN